MHIVDKKFFLYSFLMLLSSILFIVFWCFSAQYIIQTNWFTEKNNIPFDELSSGIIVIFCGAFFTFIYVICEIIILKFLLKNKSIIELKRFNLYFYMLIANFFFTALTSLIIFIISGTYYFKYLFKESGVIHKKIEEFKKKKEKKV